MKSIYKSWNLKEKKVSKKSTPMVGSIYKGLDKFFGREVEGVLVEMFGQNDEGVLRTKEGINTSVDINSLTIVVGS